jgi:transposase
VLLKVDEGDGGAGWTDEKATESCDVSVRTVANLRRRFVEQGLEAALNRQKQSRLSRQPILDGEKEAKLVALCCGTVPAGHGRWTLRLLADKLVELEIVDSISHETVRQCLKKTS